MILLWSSAERVYTHAVLDSAKGCGMSGELTGKVAIVTGGASGIGKGCGARFVDAGAKVVIADVNTEAGEAFAAELGADAAFKETDVADADSVAEVVAFAVERFGGLHCMFNNAGISGNRNSHLLDEDFSRLPPSHGHQRAGGRVRHPGRGAAHEGARWRVDHQHDVDRRDASRPRPLGLRHVEGEREHALPVGRDRSRRVRHPRATASRPPTSSRRSSATCSARGCRRTRRPR